MAPRGGKGKDNKGGGKSKGSGKGKGGGKNVRQLTPGVLVTATMPCLLPKATKEAADLLNQISDRIFFDACVPPAVLEEGAAPGDSRAIAVDDEGKTRHEQGAKPGDEEAGGPAAKRRRVLNDGDAASAPPAAGVPSLADALTAELDGLRERRKTQSRKGWRFVENLSRGVAFLEAAEYEPPAFFQSLKKEAALQEATEKQLQAVRKQRRRVLAFNKPSSVAKELFRGTSTSCGKYVIRMTPLDYMCSPHLNNFGELLKKLLPQILSEREKSRKAATPVGCSMNTPAATVTTRPPPPRTGGGEQQMSFTWNVDFTHHNCRKFGREALVDTIKKELQQMQVEMPENVGGVSASIDVCEPDVLFVVELTPAFIGCTVLETKEAQQLFRGFKLFQEEQKSEADVADSEDEEGTGSEASEDGVGEGFCETGEDVEKPLGGRGSGQGMGNDDASAVDVAGAPHAGPDEDGVGDLRAPVCT
eukprot:g5361.t1